MSPFAAALARGVNALYAKKGEPVTYTQEDDWTTNCTAVVSRDVARYGDVMEVNASTVDVRIRIADLPERPRRGELITIGDDCLTVGTLIRSTQFEHRFIAS
ncbi:MAG: hypothetical protein AAGI72_23685 [Pseudomonadota bacterium]